jgi:cation-transporting P-type ATPase I
MGLAGLVRDVVAMPASLVPPAVGLGVDVVRHTARETIGRFAGLVPRPPTAPDLAHRGRRVWVRRGRAHLELREVDDERVDEYLAAVVEEIGGTPGVESVQVLAPIGRVVVEYDPDLLDPPTLVDLVSGVEAGLGFGSESFGKHRPAHPGDVEPLAEAAVSLTADLAAIGLAGAGRAARLPRLPIEVDAAALLAVASYLPWVRSRIEHRVDSPALGVGLAVSRAIAAGLAQNVGGPVIDVVHRTSQIAAAEARRQAWARMEPELMGWHGASVGGPLRPARRAGHPPSGPIERFAVPTGFASVGAAAIGTLVRPDLDRAMSFMVAGLPKAARWGRQAFTDHLGVHLSSRDLIVLDPPALEMLDRIDRLVIEDRLLVERVGRHWEAVPYAPELMSAAREAGLELWVATDDDARVRRFDIAGTVPAGPGSADAIRSMQVAGSAVAVIAGGLHPALAVADVGLGLRLPGEPIPWTATVVGGGHLVDGYLLLLAIGAAKVSSRQAAHVALAGAGVGGLMAFGAVLPGNLDRVMGAVNLAALVAHANGTRLASTLARQPLPEPPDLRPFHAIDPVEVLAMLESAPEGLSDQVAAARYAAPPDEPTAAAALLRAVANELVNPLTPFLAAGAGLSAAAGSASDAVLVGGVVALNALLGGVQRFKADRATAALLRRERHRVTVIRGGLPAVIDADLLVPGDLVVLEPGDVVPADCRILTCHALEVDESSLTGESLPVAKTSDPMAIDAPVAERLSMLYAGTTLAAGSAVGVVAAVGRRTEAYRGLLLSRSGPPETGVEARLESITTMVTPVSVLAGLGVLGSGLLRRQPLADMVGAGVSLAVAAVPEGLPLLATAAQQAAARRLSHRGVIVRNARAIEALGRVDVVCADKTGTLTLGRIRVAVVGDGLVEEVPEFATGPRRTVLETALLATPPAEPGVRLPHPTDRALVYAAEAAGIDLESVGRSARETEIPFEPRRGYHATVVNGGVRRLAVKGAPEVVIDRCTAHLGEDGAAEAFTPALRHRVEAEVDRLAGRGLRVLVVAGRALDSGEPVDDSSVRALVFHGLLGLQDPVRPTAAEAVDLLRRAGVRVIMITGDHPTTATGIGEELGIGSNGRVLTGSEIDRIDDRRLGERLVDVEVCARVTPAHKVRIVRALQQQGRVVAMTGDGANDAPAIRLADVGIALGTRATDAARDASDLVVTDDRIETIVEAVVEGRALWSSVRDATAILVGGNLGEIAFTLTGAVLTGTPPLNARQLLLVNLLTDVAPAMAIAVAPPRNRTPEALLVEGPDRSLGEVLNRSIALRAATTTLGTGGAWLSARLTGRAARAGTVALVALVGTELGQTITAGHRSPMVLASGIGSAAIMAGIVQTPGLSHAFGCTPLGPLGWAQALTAASMATLGSTLAPRLLPLARDAVEPVADPFPATAVA